MRNRIVVIDPDLYCHMSDNKIAEMREDLNDFGINPLFIVKGIKILEPEKKRKKHRLTRKRRSKRYESLDLRISKAKFTISYNKWNEYDELG